MMRQAFEAQAVVVDEKEREVEEEEEGPVGKLMKSTEYSDLEEPVLVEGDFVEVNEAEEGMALFHLALTETQLIMAIREVQSYETHPYVNRPFLDIDTEGLIIKSMISMQLIRFGAQPEKFKLIMHLASSFHRQFLLCTTVNVFDRFLIWFRWIDEINALYSGSFIRKPMTLYNSLPKNMYGLDAMLYNDQDLPEKEPKKSSVKKFNTFLPWLRKQDKSQDVSEW